MKNTNHGFNQNGTYDYDGRIYEIEGKFYTQEGIEVTLNDQHEIMHYLEYSADTHEVISALPSDYVGEGVIDSTKYGVGTTSTHGDAKPSAKHSDVEYSLEGGLNTTQVESNHAVANTSTSKGGGRGGGLLGLLALGVLGLLGWNYFQGQGDAELVATTQSDTTAIPGCTNECSDYYNPNATVEDGSCWGPNVDEPFECDDTSGTPGEVLCCDNVRRIITECPVDFNGFQNYGCGTDSQNPVINNNDGNVYVPVVECCDGVRRLISDCQALSCFGNPTADDDATTGTGGDTSANGGDGNGNSNNSCGVTEMTQYICSNGELAVKDSGKSFSDQTPCSNNMGENAVCATNQSGLAGSKCDEGGDIILYDNANTCALSLKYECAPVSGSDLLKCSGDFTNTSKCDNLSYNSSITVQGGTIVDGPNEETFIHRDTSCKLEAGTGLTCTGPSPIGAFGNQGPEVINRPAGEIDDFHNFYFRVQPNGCEEVSVRIGIQGVGAVTNSDSCMEILQADTCGSGDPVVTTPPVDTCTDDAALNTNAAADCIYPTQGCTDPDAQNTTAGATDDDGSCVYNGCEGLTCTGGLTTKPAKLCKTGSNAECGAPAPVTCCDGTTAATLAQCPTDHNGQGASNGCGTHTSGGTPGCDDSQASNYNPDATSNDGSCKYAGCVNNTCDPEGFDTPQTDTCSSNDECIPNAVCDGNMVVDVNQPIACGDEGTIDVTVSNVNSGTITIECDGGHGPSHNSFGTQSAMVCTSQLQNVYDTITAEFNTEEEASLCDTTNELMLNNMANAFAATYGVVPYDAYQAITACCGMDMSSFTTQQAHAEHDHMAYCNASGTCDGWTVNLTHEVLQYYYIRLMDETSTIVGEGVAAPSSLKDNYITGDWITQPAEGKVRVQLFSSPDYTGEFKDLEIFAPNNCDSCDKTFPDFDESTLCEGEVETIYNECNESKLVQGTKTDGNCYVCDTTYDTIDLGQVCIGDSEIIRNECGNAKRVRGEKNCDAVCTANPTTITKSYPIPAGATSCKVTVQYDSTTCKNCNDGEIVKIILDETDAPGTTCDDGDASTNDDTINDQCECKGTPEEPVDCEVSDFSEWICDTEAGLESRSRTITTNPTNGGATCPELEQERECDVENYDLALRKTIVESDAGYYTAGDEITFKIEVFNQGDITASGIEVTDYIPEGLTFVESSVSHVMNGDMITLTLPGTIEADASKDLTITFTIDANYDGLMIENIAEISSDDGDDCDSTPDSIIDNDGNIIDDNIGDGCNEGGDEDDHDHAIIELEICNGQDDNGNGDTDEGFEDMMPGMTCDDGDANTANDVYNEVCVCNGVNIVDEDEYDLALMKDLATGQSRTVAPGDEVTFTITVTNQGDITANTYTLVDHLPTGLSLNDADWTDIGSNNAEIILTETLTPGSSTTVDITTTVGDDINGELINVVEISDDDGDDVDSSVNNDNGDQSEDDEDAEPLTVVSGEVCDGIDNNGDGTVDEGFEDKSPGTVCDDGRARTYGDVYNDQCECVGITATGGSGGGNNFCGDGVVKSGEECDDGNYDNGDGCNSNCQIEGFCGDGEMNVVGEQCDDGNITSNDGCSATCLTEIILTCGDSAVNQEWEDCDDGNTIDGDGCSATCQLEIEEDIVTQILEMKKEPVPAPAPRVITPLALPVELPQTGADMMMCMMK